MAPRLTMAESIENAPFSTRLKNALRNMAALPINKIHNLDDVISLYRRDSFEFQAFFLRIPGAGRISLDELITYADKLEGPDDYTGRTVAIAFEEAVSMQDAIAEACNSIESHTHTYRALRRLQSLLDAATIHLEQAEDQRRMFQVRKEV